MAAHQNVIDLGFDVDAITAEKKQVLDLFIDLFGKLQEYDGTKINPLGGGGLTDLKKSITDGAKAMSEYQEIATKYNQTITEQAQRQAASRRALTELTAEQKAAAKIQDDLTSTNAKIAAASSDAAKQLAQQKIQLQQLNAENKNAAKDALGLVSAYDKLDAEQKAAAKSAAEIGIAMGTDSQEYKTAAAAANTLNDKLKELDGDTGKFGRHVGNYSGAFQDAFNVLKDQLAATKTELGDLENKGQSVVNNLSKGNPIGFDPNRFKGDITSFAKTGGGNAFVAPADAGAYQELSNRAVLLEKNIERLSVGFRTTRQESRAFQEAATEVGLALGKDSEEFLVFDKAIGHTQNAINDIKAASKFQATDAKFITGLANAASTLAGGFGAAQAAESLFAGEDEDTQKQLAKFQQLLVLINGLQAVANGLQVESGGVQLLLAARTSLVNAAKATQLLLTTRAIQVIEAETAATAVNAETKELAVGATGEQTAAEELQTAATVQNTEALAANSAASGVAKGATTSLTTSFVAGGIATLAIAAGVALALLTAKLLGYSQQTGITLKQQKDIIDATKELNDALEGQAKILDELDVSQKNYYTSLISNAQDAGASQYALLLAQERFDKAQADNAKAEIDRLGATDAAYSKAANSIQILRNQQEGYINVILDLNKIPEKDQTSAQKTQIQVAKNNLEINKSQLDNATTTFEQMKTAREKFKEFSQKADSDETKFNKLSVDEQLDVVEKTETLRANLVKARNTIILSDEASTLQQRLTAIKSNLKQENDILAAQSQKINNNPSNFINGLLTPQAQQQLNALNEQRKEIALKGAKDISDVQRSYYERDRNADLASFRSQTEQKIKLAQDLQQGKQNNPDPFSKPTPISLSDRLSGLSQEYEARRNLLNAELKVELDKEGQTEQEKLALYEKYGADIADLGREFKQTYLNLEKEAQERSIAEWQLYYDHRKNQINENETSQIVQLNAAAENGLVRIRQYARQRQKIEDEAATARAQAAVQNAYVVVNSTKAGTKERADAEGQLTETVKNLSDTVKQKTDNTTTAQRDKILNTLGDIQNGYQSATQGIGTILDIGYDNQKTKIENLDNLQEKSFQKEVSQIQGSTASEEEKAARLKLLETERQTQKEANDRRTRQLDVERAQFEKAASITSIVLGTTEAIIGFLHNPGGFAGIGLSIAAGITGAAQLAKAVATQVPHYKLGAGVNGHPLHAGGLMVVGDGGEQELVTEPGKPAYLSDSKPQLINAAPMTSVVPLSMLNDMSRMWITDQGILSYQPDNSQLSQKFDRLNNTMLSMAASMKESAKNNRPTVIVNNNIAKDMNHLAWVRKNVFE